MGWPRIGWPRIGRTNAFATLAAVGLLVLTAALLSGSVLASQQLVLDRGRAEAASRGRSAAWEAAGALLSAIQQTWNADEQGIDAWWTQHSGAFPAVSELVSLSSRINLNTLTPFLLQDSELAGTLKGRTVGDFVNYRLDKGPLPDKQGYKDYIQPAALSSMYDVYSLFNVNTADEIMLERVVAARTGNDAFASAVRARIRDFRARKQLLTDADLDMLLGAEKDAVGELLTLDPEIDVNVAPVEVLQAVLRDPDLKVTQPDAKVQTIVAGRFTRPWSAEGLRQALGVDKTSLLMQYLGTRTRFLRATVHEQAGELAVVVVVDYSRDSPPRLTLRVLRTEWTRS